MQLVARDPVWGELLRGTGGIRKARYANIQARGKSGGARIVYLYTNDSVPIFLLGVFGKNEKSNLSAAERNALRGITREIVSTYGASRIRGAKGTEK